MHNTRLSIFILPILIIGLSIFTTYVEENPSFATLFSISQVANPTAGEESNQNIEEVVSGALEEAEEIIGNSPDIATLEPSQDGSALPIDGEVGISDEQGDPEVSTEPLVETAIEDTNQVNGGGISEGTETQTEPISEEPEPETNEEIPESDIPEAEEEIVEEVPVDEAVLFAQKIAQYEVSKSMISSRFQQNLLRLEQSRDEIRSKIITMEQEGKDVSRANEALLNLEDAIVQSKQYMRDSTQPESIGVIQSMLLEYISNIRRSLNAGYSQLFNAIQETQ